MIFSFEVTCFNSCPQSQITFSNFLCLLLKYNTESNVDLRVHSWIILIEILRFNGERSLITGNILWLILTVCDTLHTLFHVLVNALKKSNPRFFSNQFLGGWHHISKVPPRNTTNFKIFGNFALILEPRYLMDTLALFLITHLYI